MTEVLESRILDWIATELPKIQAAKHRKAPALEIKDNDVTARDVLLGLRGKDMLWWEGSTIDPLKGLVFRGGYDLHSLNQELNKKTRCMNIDAQSPIEGLMWLLLTGELPNKREVDLMQGLVCFRGRERGRGREKDSRCLAVAKKAIDAMSEGVPVLTRMAVGVLAMGESSAHREGLTGLTNTSNTNTHTHTHDSTSNTNNTSTNNTSTNNTSTNNTSTNINTNTNNTSTNKGGVDKAKLWSRTLNDVLLIWRMLPAIAGHIARTTVSGGSSGSSSSSSSSSSSRTSGSSGDSGIKVKGSITGDDEEEDHREDHTYNSDVYSDDKVNDNDNDYASIVADELCPKADTASRVRTSRFMRLYLRTHAGKLIYVYVCVYV